MKKERGLIFLYHTKPGRIILKIITKPAISKLIGYFLDSSLSRIIIKRFIKKNKINMEEYEPKSYKNFNEFFSRQIKKEYRPINKEKKALISPSDGYLSVYKIKKGLILPIKQSKYSIFSLLKNEELAKKYQEGMCLVIRLAVNNYHRYCYIDSGTKEGNIFIPGILHTVRPIALKKESVFIENSREYTILHTKNFKDVVEIEVGALLVGKIKNYHQIYTFKKGEEKGTFLYGGSTIILLFEKDAIKIPDEYFTKTNNEEEIPVKMGEKIA